MDEDLAVSVKSVSKSFKLPHERADSVKSLFVNPFNKNRKKFEIQSALKDISFDIKKGEFFGIVGRNGSGKSTLLKIIAGIYQPNEGRVSINGRLVPFIELGVGFNPELTGRDNVYLNGALMGFSKKEIDDKYQAIVNFAEIEKFMDQKLKNYSSGMQVRLAFSVATILAESDILLIDEVLAVGDSAFQKKCFEYFRKLKEANKTVIFVSHNMSAIEEYCDRAVLIEDTEKILEGPAHEVAGSYIRMFADGQLTDKNSLRDKKKRWGSGEAKYLDAGVRPKEIKNDKVFKVYASARAIKAIDGEVILGFKIKDADGRAVVGTNTKIKNKKVILIQGQTVLVEWTLPSILNDGLYSIDFAIEAKNYSGTYDWWEDAVSFIVHRNEQSSYSINPIVGTSIKYDSPK